MDTDQNITKASKLTDIPLSVDQSGELKPIDEKLSGKSNSLKRFFKMPSKRGIAVVSTSELANSKAAGENADTDAAGQDKQQKEKGGNMRRFHLRLGGIQKRSSSPTDFEAGSSSTTGAAVPKPGLKGSLSNYWNSVFKRHHGDKQPKDNNDVPIDDDDDDVDETEIREEVHTLAISEEEEQAKAN